MPKKIDWFLISENYGANLVPFGFHFLADYHGFKKILGLGAAYQSVSLFNGHLRQAYGLDEYNTVAEHIFYLLSNDKKFTHKMLNKTSTIISQFHTFNKKNSKIDLGSLSKKQLYNLFNRFYKYFYEMSMWSVPFSYTEYGTPLWTNFLTDYLNSLKLPAKYNGLEIYQILTTSKRKTYTAREKEDILKLAIEVKEKDRLKKIFKLPADEIERTLALKDKKFLSKIERHTKNYNWINFAFEGPLQDREYFITSIKDVVAHKKPENELQKIYTEREAIYQTQKELFNKLGIDSHHQYLFWVVREFGFQKTYRKDIEYHSYYVYDLMLKEFGRRFNISSKQGHYLLIDEVLKILLGKKKINPHELNKRIEACSYIIENGKEKLLIGEKAINFNKKIKARKIPKGLKELNGQCACKGKIKGVAKIIKNKEDYPKFKAGDVLISYATNPNMVPLMKKAAAIVTDEGGVTCHAAIVSRELNIPCVIGTRFATAALKDGDMVEVDANKGVVKKL